MYLKVPDLSTFDLNSGGLKFDVILIDPPLEEYQRRASGINFSWNHWDWDEVWSGREGCGQEGKVWSGKEGCVVCKGGRYWYLHRVGGQMVSFNRDFNSPLPLLAYRS